ncbi:hypothetical protein ACROYT_G010183 [Oculina patagonica]
MGAARIKLSPIGIVVIGLVVVAIIYYLSTDGGSGEFSHRYFEGEDTVSMKRLIKTAIHLAEKGGDVVRKIRLGEDLGEESKGQTREGANNPVTQGDMLSHRAMFYGFKKEFSKLNVVSEEHDHGDVDLKGVKSPDTSAINLDSGLHNKEDEIVSAGNLLVWIDPLDATQEYTENLIEYVTTMICIAVNGRPVAGIIHKPFLHQTYWAWVGHGSSDNIKVPQAKESALKTPRVIVSRSHAGKVNATARLAFGPETKVIPAGGAGYKVLSLFEDKADTYVHVTLIKKWDICAGDALLRTFGGKMTTLDNEEIKYGDGTKPANEKGLLAAIHNHAEYQQELAQKLKS